MLGDICFGHLARATCFRCDSRNAVARAFAARSLSSLITLAEMVVVLMLACPSCSRTTSTSPPQAGTARVTGREAPLALPCPLRPNLRPGCRRRGGRTPPGPPRSRSCAPASVLTAPPREGRAAGATSRQAVHSDPPGVSLGPSAFPARWEEPPLGGGGWPGTGYGAGRSPDDSTTPLPQPALCARPGAAARIAAGEFGVVP